MDKQAAGDADMTTYADHPGPLPNLDAQTSRPDFAAVLGLTGAFGLIAAAIVLGGSWGAFIDVPAILIVVVGTFAVTLISFSIEDIAKTQQIVAKAVAGRNPDPTRAALQTLQLADFARQESALSLQKYVAHLHGAPFFARGLQMVVDGTPIPEVEQAMLQETEAMAERHARGVSVLRRAAEVAPAMGLIGTLVGLVQMLGNLDDPTKIGPSMAVALLTTFYGAILANMVFAPLAAKLDRRSSDEQTANEVFRMGVVSIGSQRNPRQLEVIINTILPPIKRVAYFR